VRHFKRSSRFQKAGSCDAVPIFKRKAIVTQFLSTLNESWLMGVGIVVIAWLPLAVTLMYKLGYWIIAMFAVATFCIAWRPYSHDDQNKCLVEFTFKNQYDTKANILQGITLGPWLEIIITRWRYIDWKVYWFRLLYLSLLAFINSLFALFEFLAFETKVQATPIDGSPVFILGHPRTGTTHLFNLLSKDTERFIFPNTFHCGFPSGMLTLSKHKHLLSWAIDSTRPMDNMALDFDQPQEDELALNMMTAGRSPYMPLVFMNCEPEFRKYFSFESASFEDKETWIDSFKYFMRKVTYDWSRRTSVGNKHLLLKSPCHCSRASLLHQLFPKAKFVYIHRNPYVVWKSAVNMADTTYWYSYLAKPTNNQILEFIMNQYQVLFEDYISARKSIPPDQLIEVSYAELTGDTTACLRRVYQHFNWTSFESFEPQLNSYLSSLKSYTKNDFTPLKSDVSKYIYSRWRSSFEEFGYPEQEGAE